MTHAAILEVEALHQFFQNWFTGAIPDNDKMFARLCSVMAPGFEMVDPKGRTVDRAALLTAIRPMHGKYRRLPFRIEIHRPRCRALGMGLILVSYEEWQDTDGEITSRQSTAVLRQVSGKPNGLVWEHVHETALDACHPTSPSRGSN